MFLKMVADGSLFIILIVGAAAILYAVRNRFWTTVPILIMAGLTSLVIGKLLSVVYQPSIQRPFVQFGAEPGAAYIDNPGFPSDHALLGVVIVLAVYVTTRNKQLTIILTLLTIAMCVGRVAALVHTPLDIVGGIVAGMSGSLWYKKLTKHT